MSCGTLEPQGRDEKLWALTSMLELSQHQSAGCTGPWAKTVPYPTPTPPSAAGLTWEAPRLVLATAAGLGVLDVWATCRTRAPAFSKAGSVLPGGPRVRAVTAAGPLSQRTILCAAWAGPFSKAWSSFFL